MKKNFELLQVDKFKKFSQGQGVILGPGDDAAVLESFDPQKKQLVFCGDMIIEDVHFDRAQLSFKQIGRKAAARTLSDFAAMAAWPRYMGFSVAMPKEDRIHIDDIMQGARDLLREFDCDLVGGDMSKANSFICDTWAVGEVEKDRYITRSGAKDKDCIFVAGKLGGSYDSKRHALFLPQIQKAKDLVSKYKVNSMMDISDGLVFDLYRILEESNVSAVLSADNIPCYDEASLNNALYDGEDYVLLFTAHADYKDDLIADHCFYIGDIKSGSVELYLEKNNEVKLLDREGFSSLS